MGNMMAASDKQPRYLETRPLPSDLKKRNSPGFVSDGERKFYNACHCHETIAAATKPKEIKKIEEHSLAWFPEIV
jgi:hypothetical protein